MYPPKQRKEDISEKIRQLAHVIRRDKYVIIISILLAITVHMYVRYEKAKNNVPVVHELAVPD